MDRFDIGPDGKPCRACFSVEDMMKKGRELAEKRSRDGGSDSNKSGAKVEKEVDSVKAPTRKDCPVDRDELGRSTCNLPVIVRNYLKNAVCNTKLVLSLVSIPMLLLWYISGVEAVNFTIGIHIFNSSYTALFFPHFCACLGVLSLSNNNYYETLRGTVYAIFHVVSTSIVSFINFTFLEHTLDDVVQNIRLSLGLACFIAAVVLAKQYDRNRQLRLQFFGSLASITISGLAILYSFWSFVYPDIQNNTWDVIMTAFGVLTTILSLVENRRCLALVGEKILELQKNSVKARDIHLLIERVDGNIIRENNIRLELLTSSLAESRMAEQLSRTEGKIMQERYDKRQERIDFLESELKSMTGQLKLYQRRKSEQAPHLDEPVINVGGGFAGPLAALEALDQGAKVVIVDSEKSLGGNSAKASSGMRACNTDTQEKLEISDSGDRFYADTMAAGDKENDEALVDVLVEESSAAVDFLQSNRVDLGNVIEETNSAVIDSVDQWNSLPNHVNSLQAPPSVLAMHPSDIEFALNAPIPSDDEDF